MAKSTRRGRGAARVDVMEMWQQPKQWLPLVIVGAFIRWRAEIVIVLVWGTGMVYLQANTNSVVPWLVFGAVLAVLYGIPASRRFVNARMWCLVDRHRLRTCLRNAKVRTMNLDGALPFMLWARPTRTGERIWLWTRAGSSPDELESVLGYVAPACYARDARLHRVRKLATIVAIEVIRRDPLDTTDAVDSPLSRLIGKFSGKTEGSEPIQAATITPLPVPSQNGTAPAPAAAAPAATSKTTRKNNGTAPATAAGPSVVVNGEDLSDYID